MCILPEPLRRVIGDYVADDLMYYIVRTPRRRADVLLPLLHLLPLSTRVWSSSDAKKAVTSLSHGYFELPPQQPPQRTIMWQLCFDAEATIRNTLFRVNRITSEQILGGPTLEHLVHARRHGLLDKCDWMIRRCNMTREACLSCPNSPIYLGALIASGELDVIRWIAKRWHMTRQELLPFYTDMCRSRHGGIALWFVRRCGLSRAEREFLEPRLGDKVQAKRVHELHARAFNQHRNRLRSSADKNISAVSAAYSQRVQLVGQDTGNEFKQEAAAHGETTSQEDRDRGILCVQAQAPRFVLGQCVQVELITVLSLD